MKVINQTAINERKNRIPFPIRHITTFAVNDARCTGFIPVQQGDRLHVDYSQFSRLSPLVAPTFGNFKIQTHAFFVPLRLIWPHYGEYMDASSDVSFDSIKVPRNFSLAHIIQKFASSSPSPVTNGFVEWKDTTDDYVSDDYDSYDLRIVRMSAVASEGIKMDCYNFTPLGRMFWNNMQALGYSLPTFVVYNDDNSPALSEAFPGSYNYFIEEKYSIYPLLAFARCFYDYLYPSQYITQQGYGYLFTEKMYGKSIAQIFTDVFDMVCSTYQRNFWTSLWQQPNQVAMGGSKYSEFEMSANASSRPQGVSLSSNLSLSNVNDGVFVGVNDSPTKNAPQDTVLFGARSGSDVTVSADSLRWLQRISDFVLRNNIGGTRVREYFKSHFGFTPSSINDNYATYIRTFSDDVTIQDVTNMSTPLGDDGKPAVLGEQGGKGVSRGNNQIKFESSEKGYIVFITQIVPSVGYYQGIKEFARAIKSRFDLYTPDFDGVGMVGVPRSALFSLYNSYEDVVKVPLNTANNVLGFAPNYAEKKIGYDFLTGDFLFNSRNKQLSSYHTFRDVLYGRSDLGIDRQFMTADNQYQRIFAYTGEENEQGQYAQYDKIFSFIRFDCTRYTNMKSLSESLPFFEDEGKKVSSDYEGKQL